MFFKVLNVALVAITFSTQVYAHAVISPVLGVDGTAKRADVERPSTAKPCGATNIAANIDSTTPIVAAADGSFIATVTNFNAGRDGSRQVSLTVDAAGTGKNFVAGKVTKNGVLAPTSTGSEKITASLPAGTKCTGGASGNLCLASFKTAGGFGNCVVVQQAASSTSAASATSSVVAASTATTATATPTDTSSTNANSTNAAVAAEAPPRKNNKQAKRAAAVRGSDFLSPLQKWFTHRILQGTRAARVFRAGPLAGGQLAKRKASSWIWA
ncbi:hypothetical protein H0H87_011931 [Tephrocybe sp. NHM501043]|nr:hypothetical protein H0H87_011931 [Tephrocybe sp. NHM501043]